MRPLELTRRSSKSWVRVVEVRVEKRGRPPEVLSRSHGCLVFIGCGEEYSRLLIKESRLDGWCPNIDQSMLEKREFRKNDNIFRLV